MDRLPADVDLAADRILDRGVVSVELDHVVGAALGHQADVSIDDVGDVFGSRHVGPRYRDGPSATASSGAVVTGRSQTLPRHT